VGEAFGKSPKKNWKKFHANQVTGGADATINVFDISCSTEDDALVTSTAIENTVSSLTW
jgi:hypothetical protein